MGVWGLLACHHYAPYPVPYRLRAAADLLGQVFAMQLSLKRRETELQLESQAKTVLARLVEQMMHSEHMIDGLTGEALAVHDLLDAAGSAVRIGGELRLLGETPSAETVEHLLGWIAGQAVTGDVWSTDSLAAVYPGGDALSGTAAGVLAVSLSETWQSAVLWFRPEQARTVDWGGAPKEAVGVSEDGLQVLQPRNSFAKWTQHVSGRSAPWTDGERAAAAEIRRAIVRVVLARADEMALLNAELARSNAELDAFTYIASHDLKEPLRGINNYAQFLIEDYAAVLDDEGIARLEIITKLSRRLDGFIDALLDFGKVGAARARARAGRFQRGGAGSRRRGRFRLEENGVAVQVPRPLPTVRANALHVLDLFLNLVTNAAKYARPDAEGGSVVEIGYSGKGRSAGGGSRADRAGRTAVLGARQRDRHSRKTPGVRLRPVQTPPRPRRPRRRQRGGTHHRAQNCGAPRRDRVGRIDVRGGHDVFLYPIRLTPR